MITASKTRKIMIKAKIKNLDPTTINQINQIADKIKKAAKRGEEFIDFIVGNQNDCYDLIPIIKIFGYQVEQCQPDFFSSPFTLRIRWYD